MQLVSKGQLSVLSHPTAFGGAVGIAGGSGTGGSVGGGTGASAKGCGFGDVGLASGRIGESLVGSSSTLGRWVVMSGFSVAIALHPACGFPVVPG